MRWEEEREGEEGIVWWLLLRWESGGLVSSGRVVP